MLPYLPQYTNVYESGDYCLKWDQIGWSYNYFWGQSVNYKPCETTKKTSAFKTHDIKYNFVHKNIENKQVNVIKVYSIKSTVGLYIY